MSTQAWVATLWSAPIAWDEALDLMRLDDAFLTLALRCERWPSPRAMLEALPPRPAPLRLAPPRPSGPPAAVRDALRALVAKMTGSTA